MQKALLTLLLAGSAGLLQAQEKPASQPLRIFDSEKAINAQTPEVTPRGKASFKITHNFGDFAGDNGGARRFWGIDNAADIRIAGSLSINERMDVSVARAKGAGPQQQLFETAIKYQLLRQHANDPRHPLAVTLFVNNVIAAGKASSFANQDNSFRSFGDRLSQTLQLIIARRMGKFSVQLNPTLVHRGYAISYDKKTIFALGGAARLPLTGRMNLVVDYFHPFRDKASRDAFKANDNIRFYDPLGVGLEFLTAGHVFRLNFTNSTEILENRFIPRTITSWGEGQFRWGFTITRYFRVWR